jgi:asparagine synthase (glutamine-hydrolysing)
MFLSGGIDSSAIAAIMAKMIDRPLQTFSVAFKDRAFNELEYSREVARAIGADTHEVVIDDRDFFGALPKLVWHEDEPIAHPSSVPLYFVSALARQHVTVVLTGEGSDELLAGYGKYRASRGTGAPARSTSGCCRRRARRDRRPARAAAAATLGRYARRSFLAMDRTPEAMFFDNFAAIRLADQQTLLAPALRAAATARRRTRRRSLFRRPERQQHAARSAALRRHQDVPRRTADEAGPDEHGDVDRKPGALPRSQARGIRRAAAGRVEALRADHQAHPARGDERACCRMHPEAPENGVPGAVRRLDPRRWNAVARDVLLDRRTRERGIIDPRGVETLLQDHAAGTTDGGDRIWSLLNLELWYRTFIDKQGVQTLPEPSAAARPQRAIPKGEPCESQSLA